jgi:hypothetical protein
MEHEGLHTSDDLDLQQMLEPTSTEEIEQALEREGL